ncbi:MAG: amidohydrolase family protein [Pseudomonadales bacterium]
MRTRHLLLLAVLIPCHAFAAAQNAAGWDVAAPPGDSLAIPLDVRSGTWMSVDVSPDGRQLVFDLLGDIYLLPIDGGSAQSLTSGLPWDMQPRFSPDGRHIAFTSDRAGGDNLWVMAADGSDPRPLTKEDFRLLNSPAWHPSGSFVAGRKHFTTQRSLGTGEIWLYNVAAGGEDGVQLVERPSPQFQKELGEPAFSPDGRYLYFTQNSTPGQVFEYAQDSNREVFQIRRQDLESGEVQAFVTGPGGAVRPTPSPDGRYLAFVRRTRSDDAQHTGLFLKDLQSGEERLLYAGLERDMQETWSVHGVYPHMAWTPDGASVVFWAGGGIRRIEVASGEVVEVPFHVQDSRTVIRPPRFPVDVAPEQVDARMVRFASVSPDGRRVVFEALGRLWLKELASGATRRLTRDQQAAFELFPAWSRDGRQLAFVRWTDAELGRIHLVSAAGGRSRAVTEQPGHYRHPSFSPDGETLVFERGSGGRLTSPLWSMAPGIYRMPAAGGEMLQISDGGADPHFAARNDRVYFSRAAQTDNGNAGREFVSADLHGGRVRVHASGRHVSSIRVSPNDRWLAFRDNYDVHVMPMAPGGVVELARKSKALPLRRVSVAGGDYPNWAGGSRLSWTSGANLYSADVAELFVMEPDGAVARASAAASAVDLSVSQPADVPVGTLALIGARVVTMAEDERVIDDAVVVVRGNRIVAVGSAGEVDVPGDAERIDMTGRTILPGLIDVHAHGPQGVDDIIPQQNWLALAHLAFGVTTVHDPSNRASEIFAAAEYQRAGVILAPRIFSTGEIIYGARGGRYAHIDTLDHARAHVRRLKAQGAIAVKNYNQPRREQRQMVVTAAREEGLMVVAEGGSLYHMDMNLIADGNTGVEHNVPGERFYDDVLQFWAGTAVGYTPTLVVNYGGIRGEDWFYQHDDVWQHPLLSRFVPPSVLLPRSVRRQMAPDSDYQPLLDSAANAARLMQRGVLVNIGAHGQREGLGAHWEIWAFVLGGMSPLDALKTATLNPARYLGLDGDIGSVEPGKLADLLIVDGNPLENIRDTDKVAYVMQNGRLYQGGTLAETVTGQRRLAPFFWQ